MKIVPADNKGMSLIEITLAMGILATALSLLFGSLISVTVIGRLNEQRAVANTAVTTVLEDMRGMALNDLMEYTPEIPAHPGVERTISLECFKADGTAVPLPLVLATDPDTGAVIEAKPVLPNPLEIKATLLWKDERGHVYKTEATTSVGR